MKKHIYVMLIVAIVALASLTGCLLDHENIAVKNQPSSLNTVINGVTVESLSPEPKNIAEQTVMLTQDTAKTIAISHAKADKTKLRDYDIELELERGVTYYDISFESEGREYDYEIEAYTGEILHHEVERDR